MNVEAMTVAGTRTSLSQLPFSDRQCSHRGVLLYLAAPPIIVRQDKAMLCYGKVVNEGPVRHYRDGGEGN